MAHIRWMSCLRVTYVVLAFCAALCFGALKGLLVGPIAASLLIIGNISIILGLFPAHLAWTGYSIVKTPFCMFGLKILMLVALPLVACIWLAIGIGGSFLIGVGYGFFTPWIATFEAFRQETEPSRFIHFIVDGTWSTIKGSCTVVRDFLDISYHSYNSYLKEFREKESRPCDMRLRQVPACIVVGLMGIIVDVPLFTVVAISKSPYLLLRGWHRLIYDLISREGPFFETACLPIAGVVILLWPLLVIGGVLLAIFSSFFVGLYGAVIVYQESSFLRGMAYTIAMVADFDEYTNDLLYLREGTCFPRPNYRKKRISKSLEPSTKPGHSSDVSVNPQFFRRANATAEHELVPNLTASRSIRETIQEVKMVQVWENIMKNCEMRGKELVDLSIITASDCEEWFRSSTNVKSTIIGVGLPSYSMLCGLLHSIRAGTLGLLMVDGTEVTYVNRPKDRIMDWFFHPIIVLKDQIDAAKIIDTELRFIEKLILMSDGNIERMEAWDNGAIAPDNAMRNGEIQAISRRLQGLVRNMSRYPTYRRRYQQVVKVLLCYAREKECGTKSRKTGSTRGSRKEESSQHFTSIDIISIV